MISKKLALHLLVLCGIPSLEEQYLSQKLPFSIQQIRMHQKTPQSVGTAIQKLKEQSTHSFDDLSLLHTVMNKKQVLVSKRITSLTTELFEAIENSRESTFTSSYARFCLSSLIDSYDIKNMRHYFTSLSAFVECREGVYALQKSLEAAKKIYNIMKAHNLLQTFFQTYYFLSLGQESSFYDSLIGADEQASSFLEFKTEQKEEGLVESKQFRAHLFFDSLDAEKRNSLRKILSEKEISLYSFFLSLEYAFYITGSLVGTEEFTEEYFQLCVEKIVK